MNWLSSLAISWLFEGVERHRRTEAADKMDAYSAKYHGLDASLLACLKWSAASPPILPEPFLSLAWVQFVTGFSV